MAGDTASAALRDLLLTTKDGDWGKELPEKGLVPHRVIRGTDFPGVRIGDTKSVPVRYLSEATVHRRTLMPDDILLETAGGSPGLPTGRSLLITERLLSSLDLPATCASFARFLRVDPSKAVPSFVYWYLQYLYASGQMEEHQVQHTGVARFQYTKFAETEQIPLPDPEEQRAIAHILGTLDDKIELNWRMNETLEAIALALFKSWFVDFDPARRNMARNGRGQPSSGTSRYTLPKVEGSEHRPSTSGGGAGVEGRIEKLDALFPDSFEDSELVEIPKGWKVRKLGDLLELAYGKALKANDRNEGSVPVFGSNGQVGWHDERLVAGPGIIVGRKGNPGVVTWAPTDFFAIDTTFYVVPKPTCGSLHFLFHALREQDLASLGADSAVPGLNRNLAYLSDQVIPYAAILEVFENMSASLSGRVYHANEEARTLAALRDTLLPKLISGELRVRDAERFIAKVGL